jgi:hypothetical protein
MVFRAGQLAQVSLDKIERTEWPDPDSKDMTTRTGLLGQDSRAGRDRQDRTAGTAELEKEFWDRLVWEKTAGEENSGRKETTGRPEHDNLGRIAGTGQLGQVSLDRAKRTE